MKTLIAYEWASFWTQDDGVLYGKLYNMDANHRLDQNTAKRYLNTTAELSNGVPMPFLMDLRNIKGTFSNEAGLELAMGFKMMPHIVFEAYVVNSFSISLLVQSYKRIYNTKVPFAIFDDMGLAQENCSRFKTDFHDNNKL